LLRKYIRIFNAEHLPKIYGNDRFENTFKLQDLVTTVVPMPLGPSWKFIWLHESEASTYTAKDKNNFIVDKFNPANRGSVIYLREVWLMTSKIFAYLGSISPTCLRASFAHSHTKSVKIQSSCQYLFALLGSACVKAVYKFLVKLTPSCSTLRLLKETLFVKKSIFIVDQ